MLLSSTFDNGRVQGTNGTSCTEYAQIQQHIYFEGPWKYDQLVSITGLHSEWLCQVVHEENV